MARPSSRPSTKPPSPRSVLVCQRGESGQGVSNGLSGDTGKAPHGNHSLLLPATNARIFSAMSRRPLETSPLRRLRGPKLLRNREEESNAKSGEQFHQDDARTLPLGRRSEHTNVDPTRDVKLLNVKTDGFHVWTSEEVARFEALWPIGDARAPSLRSSALYRLATR